MGQRKNKDAINVILTDIKLHASEPTNPKSLSRKIAKSIRGKKTGRAYSTDMRISREGKLEFFIPFDKKDLETFKNKKINVLIPKGLPIYLDI